MNSSKTKTDDDIIEVLVGSGFEEEKIKRALNETKSKDFDTIIRYINTHIDGPPKIQIKKAESDLENEFDASEAKKIIEENKRKNLLEQKYREELIRKTREERRRDDDDDEIVASAQLEASEKVEEKKAECVIKARMPNGDEVLIYFNKDQTVTDVFDKISEISGLKSFKVFKLHHPSPIERTDDKLVNFNLLYPRSTIFIEE